MNNLVIQTDGYKSLFTNISAIYSDGRKRAARTVNTQLLETYWRIGQYITEFKHGKKVQIAYKKALFKHLSKSLKLQHGRAFNRSNLDYMQMFYLRYPIFEKLPHKLSWTHFCELVKIDNPLERSFYENHAVLENWSTTELIRQKKASLFSRLSTSKNKESGSKLALKEHEEESPLDLIRDPNVLAFLKIPDLYIHPGSNLENRIKENLQHFLLELEKEYKYPGKFSSNQNA